MFCSKTIKVKIFSKVIASCYRRRLQNKKNSKHVKKKLWPRGPRALWWNHAHDTDEAHFCKYLLNHFISYNFYIFIWKLVIFPFFSCILHMIWLFINIFFISSKRLWEFVCTSKLIKLVPKSMYFLEINNCFLLYT